MAYPVPYRSRVPLRERRPSRAILGVLGRPSDNHRYVEHECRYCLRPVSRAREGQPGGIAPTSVLAPVVIGGTADTTREAAHG